MRINYRTLLVGGFAAGTVVGGVGAWLRFPTEPRPAAVDQRQPVVARLNDKQAEGPGDNSLSADPAGPEAYAASLQDARRLWLCTGSSRALADLAERWAQDAPEEAWTAFLQLFETEAGLDLHARENVFREIILQWGKVDFDAALEAAELVKTWKLREDLILYAVRGLAEEDAAAAFRRLEGDPELQKSGIYSAVFVQWGMQDPEAAILQLAAMDNPVRRKGMTMDIASGWAQIDPAGALRWAESLSDGQWRDEALGYIARAAGLFGRDPEAGIEALELMSDAPGKRDVAQSFIDDWVWADPERALDWVVEATTGVMQERAIARIVHSMAVSNRDEALALLDELPESTLRQQALRDVAHAWGSVDSEAALAWAETLPEADQLAALESLARKWAYENPRQAAVYAEELPEGEGSAAFVKTVAMGWAGFDPEAAVRWTADLPGAAGAEAYQSAFGQWIEVAPSQAASYAAGLENAEERLRSYPVLTAGWVSRDPEAVESWLAGIPDGLERDAAVEGLIQFYSTENPEAAAAWAGSLSDESRREEWMQRLQHDDEE